MSRILRSGLVLAFVVVCGLTGIAATARGQAENSADQQRQPSSETDRFPTRNYSNSMAARLRSVKVLTLKTRVSPQLPGYSLAVYAEDDAQTILDAAKKYNAEIKPYKERVAPLLEQLHALEQDEGREAEIVAIRQKLKEIEQPYFDYRRGTPYRVVNRGGDYLELEPLLDPESTTLIPHSKIFEVTFFKPGRFATKME